MQIATYLKNEIIDHLLRGEAYTPPPVVFLALFTSATSDIGEGTEASGGSYARKPVTFGAPSLGTSFNTAEVVFPNMAVHHLTHAALCTAASGGSFLFHGPLLNPKITFAGQNLTIDVGDIDVGFSTTSNATDFFRNMIINRFLRNQAQDPIWASIALYDSPTTRLGGGNEIAGASQTVGLTAPIDGVTTLDGNHTFESMPATTITHLALTWFEGDNDMLLQGPLETPAITASGDTARLLSGSYDLTIT